MALDKRKIYFSISSEKRSDVISINFENNKLFGKPKTHFSQQNLYHNEKIHQIRVDSKFLYLANTCENAITILGKTANKYSKRINIYPFVDKTDYPISKDHNHINSLEPLEDGIVFTAHNGGNIGSIIGIIVGLYLGYYIIVNNYSWTK